MDKMKLQPEKVTQEQFDKLPALMTAYQVMLVTGWNARELALERKTGGVKTYRREKPRRGCKRAYPKFLKTSVAKIVGFTY